VTALHEAVSPAVNEMLFACRKLGLGPRANPDSPDGPWRGQCPTCKQRSQPDERPLTIRRSGEISCKHGCDQQQIADALLAVHPSAPAAPDRIDEPRIVSLEDFIAIDEPGAEPLLGDEQGALIPEGGDVMVYGDGGAGKTTLTFDGACHLSTGTVWLGIPVARALRLLLIENEGPRPLLRQKLKRKLAAWNGPPLDGRISVFERPWGQFTFAESGWREQLAASVQELEVDVIIAGPLTRLGMDTAGTLQEVVAFQRLVADVRARSGRPLTFILVHHENKGGTVSGAWEGAGDTLLHVQAAGNGHTVVFIQKARWASKWHHETLKLAWTDGEGFELEGDRDYEAQVRELLSEQPWRTVKEISEGISAGETAVKDVLNGKPELFELRTGEAAKQVDRVGNAKVYGLRSGSNAVNAVGAFQGGAKGDCVTASPLKGRSSSERTPPPPPESALTPQRSPTEWPRSEDELQTLIDSDPGLPDDWHRIEDEHYVMANEDIEF
jgi:AAA domain